MLVAEQSAGEAQQDGLMPPDQALEGGDLSELHILQQELRII